MPHFDAVLFDLDGVLTSTASVHARYWKHVFDPVLADAEQEPFDAHDEYLAWVDGKARYDGVRDFLRARGLEPTDAEIRAIADRKQALVERAFARGGVVAFPGSVKYVKALRADRVATAVVSSSTNAGTVLRAARIDGLFDLVVDGSDATRLGLRSKPAPDGFWEAARRLGADPGRSVVIEDALSGVAAGRAGGFALVVGVARRATPDALREAGADLVVHDLGELVP